MQLIVDTDTDISGPTKMSTIQQESLNEKFINTSLIPNVYNDITDITNGNDECVKNKEIAVKECEEIVEAADQTAQHTETSQEIIINDKIEELGLCVKKSVENKKYGKTENSQNVPIDHKNEVQDNENNEIALDAPVEEENFVKVNNKQYTNNDEIHKNTKQESTQDWEFDKNELKKRVLEDEVKSEKQDNYNTENDKVETQDDMTKGMIENKIEDQSHSNIKNNVKDLVEVADETGDKIEKQNHENLEMDITNEKQDKVDSSNTSDIDQQMTHEIGHKSEKQSEHIETDIEIEEHNDVTSSVKEDNIKEEVKVDNATEVMILDQVKVTNTKEEEIRQGIEENNEMDIEIEEHNDVTSSLKEDNIKEDIKVDSANEVMIVDQVKVTNTKEEEIRQGIEENNEMDIEIEEHNDVTSSLKEDNVKEDIKVDNANEVMIVDQVKEINTNEEEIRQGIKENNEIDITNQEQDNITINVIADKIERHVGVTHEIEDKCEQQNVKNMELDLIIEKKDSVDGSVAHKDAEQVELAHKVDDKCEKQSEECIEMDVTNEEKDKVTSNDNINEEVKLNNAIEDQVKVTKEKEDDTQNKSEGFSERDVTFEEQDKVSVSVTDDKIEIGNGENSEIKFQVQQERVNTSVTIDEIDERPTNKVSVFEKEKDELEEPGNLNNSAIEDKVEKQSKDHNETKVNIFKLFNENIEIQDKLEEQQNEISAIINKLEEEEKEECQVKDNFIVQNNSDSEDKQRTQMSVTKDITGILDDGSTDNCKTSPSMVSVKEINENELDSTKTISSLVLAQKMDRSEVISHEVEKREDESKGKPENVENKTKVEAENTNQKLEQDSNREKSSNTVENNTESAVTQMDTDEIIDIADEKDDEDEKEPKFTVTMAAEEKAESALKNDVQVNKSIASDEIDLVSHDKSDPEASVKKANVEHANLKKPVTEIVEEKKKLTHLSKLSNTLDILSDEEEDLPKEVAQKEISATGKEFTSINIDDDDDVMLIDEESSPKDDKNKTESTPEPINEVIVKEDSTVESKEKKENPLSDISGNNKDTIQSKVATPSITETKVSEPKPDLMAQEKPLSPKKPLLKLDFLKTCKKNLADMTRDELEEFCILKIVESVVDRSNLSEIKSQFKALAQNIEEYQKKASVLTKQNRDLQVVLKSVQEEQKKNSNMPITPLKITRSVGMQVLMTDKVGGRKKLQNSNTAKSNASANSGPNRQGKTKPNNVRLQKTVTNTTNNSPIPVPRLVPAINSSNLNNMKLQPSPANASGKSLVTGPVNKSPIQSVSNGVPAASPVQKPEKRPHSRMQQNDSVTVDLTDDEPPAKVISRNATPPVRLVPPQNLLAPNRQPFGQNVSSPRKVYIPISGSQTPVGVRPGQTIMLRTISPQGPRQRAPTPGLAKPNQSPNSVRMQRVPSRHPAPLPESVKQYQPQNWKALPPAPELKLSKVENGIVISWKIDGYQEENYEEIASYQLYAYQETTSPPSTALWKKIGDVKALALPMACTLTQFMAGYKYYFAVRAVDIRSRFGPFSLPGSILLLNKM